ncbi:hypothetical protein Tco_0649016 [Tanacetum coccineum]
MALFWRWGTNFPYVQSIKFMDFLLALALGKQAVFSSCNDEASEVGSGAYSVTYGFGIAAANGLILAFPYLPTPLMSHEEE